MASRLPLALYGSLRKGLRQHENFFQGYPRVKFSGYDCVPGSIGLIRHSNMLYPGYWEEESPDGVIVEIYDNIPGDLLTRLDRYEGYLENEDPIRSLYLRVPIWTQQGVLCWIYKWNGQPGYLPDPDKDMELIKHGDWKKWLDENDR